MRREPTDKEIEALAAAIADADEEAGGAWPAFEGDDGRRDEGGSVGYLRLLSDESQNRYRWMARAAWFAMPTGDAPALAAESVETVRECLKNIASRAHAALAAI